MRNESSTSYGKRTILDADIGEFERELSKEYTTLSSLRDFGRRYAQFYASTGNLSGEDGELCKRLSEGAIVKLAKESVSLIRKDERKGERVTNSKREILGEIFIQLTEILEGDFTPEVKQTTEDSLEYIAMVGGL
jgi:hypothetical protein